MVLTLCGTAFCSPDDTVARIGDKTISVEQFEAKAQELRKTGYGHIKELNRQNKLELLDGIIARELLAMEGIRRGLDRDSTIAGEVEKTLQRALLRELYEQEAVQESYSFTEEQLRTFFVERQYDSEVFSQHIVCETDEKARQVLAALKGGAPFESLVGTHSVQHIQNRFGPGGWVGWFKIGELYETLKGPLSTMQPGSLYPEPVKTLVGYHVFRLKARRPVDFEASREWVEEKLLTQSRADDMERYVEELRRRYNLVAHPEAFPALLEIPPQATEWSGGDELLFTWRGGRLTVDDYMDQVGRGRALHPSSLDSARLYKSADNLAGRQIMKAEAGKLGLDGDAEIRAIVESEQTELMTKRLYRTETEKRARAFSDQDVRDFYDQNLDLFTREDGQVTEFSFIRQSIHTMLRNQAESAAMDAFLAELRETYKDQVEIFPEALDLAFRR